MSSLDNPHRFHPQAERLRRRGWVASCQGLLGMCVCAGRSIATHLEHRNKQANRGISNVHRAQETDTLLGTPLALMYSMYAYPPAQPLSSMIADLRLPWRFGVILSLAAATRVLWVHGGRGGGGGGRRNLKAGHRMHMRTNIGNAFGESRDGSPKPLVNYGSPHRTRLENRQTGSSNQSPTTQHT